MAMAILDSFFIYWAYRTPTQTSQSLPWFNVSFQLQILIFEIKLMI